MARHFSRPPPHATPDAPTLQECVWTIGKLGREKSPELQGTVSIPSTELGPRGASVGGQCGVLVDGRSRPTCGSGDSITVMLGFEISGATLSGLRVRLRPMGWEAGRGGND